MRCILDAVQSLALSAEEQRILADEFAQTAELVLGS